MRPNALRRTARNTFADRKSTRLNSSHLVTSYAVFCLKKKNTATHVVYLVDRVSSCFLGSTVRDRIILKRIGELTASAVEGPSVHQLVILIGEGGEDPI